MDKFEEPQLAHSPELRGGRAKVSPKPWNWGKAHETGCWYPVGENLWFKSHLTKAEPASQEQTPRAHPAMDVRSWRERGGRLCDGAPEGVSELLIPCQMRSPNS